MSLYTKPGIGILDSFANLLKLIISAFNFKTGIKDSSLILDVIKC